VRSFYVSTAVFFPSSAALNPALTIAANALRVAPTIAAASADRHTTRAPAGLAGLLADQDQRVDLRPKIRNAMTDRAEPAVLPLRSCPPQGAYAGKGGREGSPPRGGANIWPHSQESARARGDPSI